MSMQALRKDYRPDIDGLRAFAVLSVLFYHVSPHTLGGGFIGVDIFFVISGFLISSIIYNSLEDNSFSFIEFYVKRIRRIFPALIFCLIVCIIAGYILLTPDEYKQLGWHLFGGGVYISNFILWLESGYFDKSVMYKPLLHLWSLALEEQFYLLWPLVLFVIYKIKINIIFITGLLIFVSIVFMQYSIMYDATSTFYLPHTRVWELLAGGFLAYVNFKYKNYYRVNNIDRYFNKKNLSRYPVKNITTNFLSLISFGVLILSIFLFESDNFPSLKTLIPVMASVMLLYCGKDAFINKYILSNKVIAYIGLISYPLYIWHWPIISFLWILEGGKPASSLRFLCVVASFFMAIITYTFIEQKFRYGRNDNIKAIILFASLVFVSFMGMFIYHNDGFEHRSSIDNDDELSVTMNTILVQAKERCLKIFPEWEKMNDNICRFENPDGLNQVAIIGDSHAGHLFPGLLASDTLTKGVAVFPASCAAPYLDICVASRGRMSERVREFRQNGWKLINQAYAYIASRSEITTVILAHNPGCSYGDIVDLQNPEIKDRDIILENGMRRTFDFLKKNGKQIIVVLDNPHLPFDVQRCTPRVLSFVGENCQFSKKYYTQNKKNIWYRDILNKVIKDYPSIYVVDSSSVFCDNAFCFASKDEKILYSDRNHLSIHGSILVAPLIEELIKNDNL